eukprot:gene5872-8097_t
MSSEKIIFDIAFIKSFPSINNNGNDETDNQMAQQILVAELIENENDAISSQSISNNVNENVDSIGDDITSSHSDQQGLNNSAIGYPVQQSLSVLLNHPYHKLSQEELNKFRLEDALHYLHSQLRCSGKPIFTSMANVFSDLYWQLIENFIYSMVKFGLSDCTIMICVSDENCMRLCNQSSFPCYDFRYDSFHKDIKVLPSALEQIGELKLYHIPKALRLGVDILMIDLDVGFLDNPLKLLDIINKSKGIDVLVQKDVSFVMNRTLVGWRTWYTVPMPNIGIFYCKGNFKAASMFDIAWKDYQSINKPIKHNPGKDQNKIVNALYISRKLYGLKWKYISSKSAVLLDKIYKFEDKTYELGGDAALKILNERGASAVHTTCYEQKTKVMGLKASNAFWNPSYYDPERPTLTKKLIYYSEQQLRNEIRSLIYLAIASNRSLIIPNILGNEELTRMDLYKGRALWPGFRVAFFMNKFNYPIDILEPSFYWRIQRDYSQNNNNYINNNNPKPHILSFSNKKKLIEIENLLLSSDVLNQKRIVLHFHNNYINDNKVVSEIESQLMDWAADSVGSYDSYAIETDRYFEMPGLKKSMKNKDLANNIIQNVRLCKDIFEPKMGNRSCFDKCD